MKWWMWTMALGVLTGIGRAPAAGPEFLNWAPKPPMGWNSWDCFGAAVTEAQTRANADYMAEKLLKYGWEYVVVDIQWYEPHAKGHEYRKGARLAMDEYGRLLPAENRFPSSAGGKGFKELADHVHAKGLKFGIHLMRGIPRQAVEQNTPMPGTDVHGKDIANVKDVCPWNPDMYGLDMTRPGAQAYYDSVFALIASWGVDFVKVDDLSRPYFEHIKEVEAIRKAIDKTGRKIVLSTSPGETPIEAGEHVSTHANLWRISDDFWDDWKALRAQFARCAKWSKWGAAGHWPDADMLPFGAVRVGQKNPWTRFTHDEQVTVMTLWAIARSPLMLGGDLPRNDEWTLRLITNEEVIGVNQQSANGRQLWEKDGLIAWAADGGAGEKYVAVFNTRDRKADDPEEGVPVRIDLKTLGFEGKARVRDLWAKKDLGTASGLLPVVRFHGAELFRVNGE